MGFQDQFNQSVKTVGQTAGAVTPEAPKAPSEMTEAQKVKAEIQQQALEVKKANIQLQATKTANAIAEARMGHEAKMQKIEASKQKTAAEQENIKLQRARMEERQSRKAMTKQKLMQATNEAFDSMMAAQLQRQAVANAKSGYASFKEFKRAYDLETDPKKRSEMNRQWRDQKKGVMRRG